MSRKRTIAAIVLALHLGTPAARANPETIDLTRAFADCAGRFLAEAEHGALFGGPQVDLAMARRDAFLTLLDAVLPDARAAGLTDTSALSWRIEARAAQRALLSASTFATQPSADTRTTAQTYIARCNRLLLGA